MTSKSETVTNKLKTLIPDPIMRIVLDEFVSELLKSAERELDLKGFSSSTSVTAEAVADRIHQYERKVADIQIALMLLAYWFEPRHEMLLEKIITRIGEIEKGSSGIRIWLSLDWYPLLFLQYSAGIAALASRNYLALKVILTTTIETDGLGNPFAKSAVVKTSLGMAEAMEVFKYISGNEQHRVPLSEFLFKELKTPVEVNLDVHRNYEVLFDRYEVFSALTCADILQSGGHSPMSLLGRFAWKYQRSGSPLALILQEAEQSGDGWAPLKAGLFGGSYARFREVSGWISGRIAQLGWI